ncbi:hypothetical protein BT69DRAFT_189883 [Atractiella rhizophila]|nr:hypothetical protein BT69DRAFT_189883 [Atractiella rhizophila]
MGLERQPCSSFSSSHSNHAISSTRRPWNRVSFSSAPSCSSRSSFRAPLPAGYMVGEVGVKSGNGQNGAGSSKPKKLAIACHFCRKRKMKCDGGRPTCIQCIKRDQACTYDLVPRMRGRGKKNIAAEQARLKAQQEKGTTEREGEGGSSDSHSDTPSPLPNSKDSRDSTEKTMTSSLRPKVEVNEVQPPRSFYPSFRASADSDEVVYPNPSYPHSTPFMVPDHRNQPLNFPY